YGGAGKNSDDTGDAFVVKLNNDGKRLWGTYFGSDSSEVASSIATDTMGNIYITGYTLSISDIATTGAHQTSIQGKVDSYIAKLSITDCGVSAFINGSQNVCPGSTQSYTTQNDTGLTYNWTISGGTIISGQGTDSINILWNNPS